MKIHEFPIVKITVFFIIGLLTGYYLRIDLAYSAAIQLLSILVFCISLFYSNKKFTQNNVFGFSTLFLFFSIGMTTNILHDNRIYKNHYSHIFNTKNKHTFSLIIREKLKSTIKNNRYYAEITKIDSKESSGKIILNIRKKDKEINFVSGNKLFVFGTLTSTQKPYNPNQFDYSTYLEHKNIYAQIYTSSEKIKTSKEIHKDIYHYIFKFRERIITKLKSNGFNHDELSVLSALILGQQQDISPEIQKDYQFAGAVHILSVSGMHVGFIMILISILLSPLPNNKKSNFLKIIITLLSLWLFSLIAGLSPSVVRSAAMFSFVTIGTIINRQNNMFHTIIVSLLIILLIEPGFIFDIGFQLSYLALFYIIWLQPMLKRLWTPKSKITIYFWDILTVSIAAQIGTLPLSIYYFHQFPGLFFITNLVLVPMVFIIMILGSLLMLLSLLDFIPIFLLKTVEISIFIMNIFIKEVASIESFILKNIPLTFTLLLASYLVISAIVLLWKKFNYTRILAVLICCIIFQISLISANWESKNQDNLIVFNSKNKSVFGFKKGNQLEIACDTTITENSFERNTIQSYATANYSSITKTNSIKNCYYYKEKKIMIIDKEIVCNFITKADIIIIRNSPKINLDRLLQKINPEIIIADASNYKSYVVSWKESCKNKNIPFHSTYEKGYYKL